MRRLGRSGYIQLRRRLLCKSNWPEQRKRTWYLRAIRRCSAGKPTVLDDGTPGLFERSFKTENTVFHTHLPHKQNYLPRAGHANKIIYLSADALECCLRFQFRWPISPIPLPLWLYFKISWNWTRYYWTANVVLTGIWWSFWPPNHVCKNIGWQMQEHGVAIWLIQVGAIKRISLKIHGRL